MPRERVLRFASGQPRLCYLTRTSSRGGRTARCASVLARAVTDTGWRPHPSPGAARLPRSDRGPPAGTAEEQEEQK